MPNIQKVADLANVSIATVSRVINNSGKVSAKTRIKVEEAIKRLNYVPNMLARNFRTAESKSILILLTNISNLFYMETIRGISDYAYEKGYDILLSETNEDVNRQIDGLLKIKNHIVDGAIIMETTIKDSLLLSLEKKHPVVQCCVQGKDLPIPFVSIDNVRGGYIVARYLVEHGHRDIAFIGTNEEAKYNRDRLAGFLQSIRESGLRQDPELLTHSEISFENGGRTALKLMEGKKKPTAMFFVSDMLAIGAINALTSAGYKVPDDVAVMGFDNLSICNVVSPALTTVAQPMYDIGREAARLLVERITKGNTSSQKNVIFQPEVVARGSV
jgi:LacI family transcriptional regulator, repressor for deo operon, udp, cdd, tsx, nupC, and nupG